MGAHLLDEAFAGWRGRRSLNAMPHGFVLPPLPPDRVHAVRMAEWEDFRPHEREVTLREADVGLRREGERLRVQARVNPLYAMPPRSRRHPAVRLTDGQWVRWQPNYRFSGISGMKGWWYWLDTFNVAWGTVDPEVFRSEPTMLVDECGPLR